MILTCFFYYIINTYLNLSTYVPIYTVRKWLKAQWSVISIAHIIIHSHAYEIIFNDSWVVTHNRIEWVCWECLYLTQQTHISLVSVNFRQLCTRPLISQTQSHLLFFFLVNKHHSRFSYIFVEKDSLHFHWVDAIWMDGK